MAIETELKLHLNPKDLDAFLSHPLLQSAGEKKQLFNTYYDTAAFDLHQQKMALRVRRKGDQWLQTIKHANKSDYSLQRGEWEMPIDDNQLNFSLFPSAALQGVLAFDEQRQQVKPVFTTDFLRTTWVLQDDEGNQLELCLDQGKVTAPNTKTEILIHEIELELLQGQPHYLYEIALQLSQKIPLVLGFGSKAKHGYTLIGNPPLVEAKPIAFVASDDNHSQFFEDIFKQSVQQIYANHIAAKQADNQGLHLFSLSFATLHHLFSRYPQHYLSKKLHSDCAIILKQCQLLQQQLGLNHFLPVSQQEKLDPEILFSGRTYNHFLLKIGALD